MKLPVCLIRIRECTLNNRVYKFNCSWISRSKKLADCLARPGWRITAWRLVLTISLFLVEDRGSYFRASNVQLLSSSLAADAVLSTSSTGLHALHSYRVHSISCPLSYFSQLTPPLVQNIIIYYLIRKFTVLFCVKFIYKKNVTWKKFEIFSLLIYNCIFEYMCNER